MTVAVSWGSATHVGCVRTTNQDAILAGPTVFAVADGMGGHAAGEVASAIAVARMADLDGRPTGGQVLEAVEQANAEVIAQAGPGSGREGMGTTLSGVALARREGDEALFVFNVGDSRTYRLDHSGLAQITMDHSLVAEMVRDGEIAPDDARQHRSRNVVTRALGITSEVDVDHWWIELAPGQIFLMCSDGLTNEVPVAVIEGVLRAASSPQAAVDSLVGIALDAGARDNVSAIAVRIETVSVLPSQIDEDTARRAVNDSHPAGQQTPGVDEITGLTTAGASGSEPPVARSSEPAGASGLIDTVPGVPAGEPERASSAPTALVTGVASSLDATESPVGG